MADLNLKYTSDPTGDITSKIVAVYFGQRAIKETAAINKVNGTGMFSKVEKGTALGVTSIEGVDTCLGYTISYTILSQQIQYYNQTFALQAKLSVTYVPGEIDIKVSWESYMPKKENNSVVNSTNKGIVQPNLSPVEQEVVIRDGIDVLCENLTDIQGRGNGMIDGDVYTNSLIPDLEHAERVGDNIILESIKNLNIGINTIPNFKIKPRQYIQMPISYLYFSEVMKIDSIDIHGGSGADQSFVINTRGKKLY